MNLVATIPFSFTAIIQAEEIREAFMENIRQLEVKLVERIDLSAYGSSLEHISCCFVLVRKTEEEEEQLYKDIQEYLEEEQELYFQICLDYEEVMGLEEEIYFEYLVDVYKKAFVDIDNETFEMEEFQWGELLFSLEEVLKEEKEEELE